MQPRESLPGTWKEATGLPVNEDADDLGVDVGIGDWNWDRDRNREPQKPELKQGRRQRQRQRQAGQEIMPQRVSWVDLTDL